MNPCYAKTDSGREEIRNRTRKLSRVARNLLLIIDERHPGINWVQLVHGASDGDLRTLITEGLVAHKQDAPAGLQLRSTRSLAEALSQLSYNQLYDLMTSQARDRLGLVRGFKFVLAVEKCSGIDELRALALEFMQLILQHQGEAAAKQMRLALGVA
jgi:hypothetical protein